MYIGQSLPTHHHFYLTRINNYSFVGYHMSQEFHFFELELTFTKFGVQLLIFKFG